jgi:hypothetical protein
MKKSGLIIFAVFFMMAGEAMGGWWWPPTGGAAIVPPNPTSSDVVAITLSGDWPDSCIPNGSAVSVTGNDIYFDVIWDYPPGTACLTVITPWARTESVGPLSPGTYTVYARLIGYPQSPEEYTQMTEFIVTGQIIYVDADATGANDGSSWADAYNYLQDALADAFNGDEIRVAQGTYKPDQGLGITPGDRTATFQLVNRVTMKGGYAGFGEPDPNARDIELYETILSGDLDGNDVDVNDRWDLWNEPSRAENSYHVVTGSDVNEAAVLDGFTIAGGNANGRYNIDENLGAGMYTDLGGPTVINCTFKGNSAKQNGAGMYSSSSILRLVNCTFQANCGKMGGGMWNQTSVLTLINCTFRGNKATFIAGGMGIYDSNATLTDCTFSGNIGGHSIGGLGIGDSNVTLTNCTFTGNWTPRPSPLIMGGGGSGGLAIWGGKAIVTECIFRGNSATGGGGMTSSNADLTLTNSLFIGNSAVSQGGGLGNTSRTVPAKITNCTFSDNSAGEGGGIHNSELGSSAMLTNCILWGNTAARGPQASLGIQSSMETNYCCIEDGQGGIHDPYQGLIWGTGNIDADPCFVQPGYWDANGVWGDGDYHLLTYSPCIDVGDPNYVAEPNETDLDGKPRVIGSRIDMGAYEYSPAIPAEVRIVPRTVNLASKGKWIACNIWLGEDYDVADIDPNSILLEGEIKAELLWVDEQQQIAIARFSRSDVQAILNVGQVELTITGQLTDGTIFEGTDVIRVIDKAGKK